MNTIIFVVLILYGLGIKGHLLINLSDELWSLNNANKSVNIEAQVPGGVYSDLREGGILKEDIFFRFNDVKYRWVGLDNWTYTTEFNYERKPVKNEEISLVFLGVDTIASVYLNKYHIGNCNNMFVKYRFQVYTNILKNGTNELQVRFESPVGWAKKQAGIMPHEIPSDCWPEQYKGECHINLIRKMQASFAWDWGPAFPSMGLWKGVYLTNCWSPVLSDIGAVITKKNGNFTVEVIAWFEPCGKSDNIAGTLTARLKLDYRTVISKSSVTLTKKKTNFLEARTIITVKESDVEVWWPNGYGKQQLYKLQVSFSTEDDLQFRFTNIAFRIVELIQQPITNVSTAKGLGFHFRVNDVDIYAKGSNWIPSDILPEKSVDKSRIKFLLKSAVKAHINMLRVWGGGLYESKFFYKMCDKLGIMIWQDLMFACNMYPATDDFLSSVTTEVSQQIRRLQHHPSIVVWAGNNENEVALVQNWYGTEPNFNLFKKEYIDLYVTTIKPIVTSLDPTRTYLESSPSNGIESVKEGYIASNPQSSLYGDVHYYNYAGNLWDPAVYPKTRFTSEYGVQSLPSMNTLKEVATPSDLKLNSEWILQRQHQPSGFAYLFAQIPFNLPIPKNLQQLVYYSQINQAMAIQTESEFYRKLKSVVYSTGEGHNMGALYWQLNDVWQAPSWSSIDYSGRWKMLHYYAVKFFAPVIVTSWVTPYDWVSVYVVSDKLQGINKAKFTVSVMSTKQFVPLKSTITMIDIDPNESKEIFSEELSTLTTPCNNIYGCFFHFSLKDVYGENIAPESYLFPAIVNLELPLLPNITVTNCVQVTPKEYQITLKSSSIALFVWLEVPDVIGTFSDNGFHMIKDSIELTFTSIKPVHMKCDEFSAAVTITHVKSVL